MNNNIVLLKESSYFFFLLNLISNIVLLKKERREGVGGRGFFWIIFCSELLGDNSYCLDLYFAICFVLQVIIIVSHCGILVFSFCRYIMLKINMDPLLCCLL